MKHSLKISSFIIFAATVASAFTSCGNESELFDDPVMYQTRAMTRANMRSEPEDDSETQYPSLDEIKSNSTFKQLAATAWANTIDALTDSTRREYGFMIYWTNNRLDFGDIIAGPEVTGGLGTKASWQPDLSTRESEVCATYHCHTPIPKCASSGQRPTGLSPEDRAWSGIHRIPILVEDFSADPITYHKDYKTLNHKIYESILKRRVKKTF